MYAALTVSPPVFLRSSSGDGNHDVGHPFNLISRFSSLTA
jgi:hypothetical protein